MISLTVFLLINAYGVDPQNPESLGISKVIEGMPEVFSNEPQTTI